MLPELGSGLAQLEIDAALDCEIDGRPFSIRTSGAQIMVEVPDVATGLKLLQLGSSWGLLRQRLRWLKQLLEQMQHSLQLNIGPHAVVAIGHRVGSPLWAILGLPPLDLRPLRLLAAYFRRKE